MFARARIRVRAIIIFMNIFINMRNYYLIFKRL